MELRTTSTPGSTPTPTLHESERNDHQQFRVPTKEQREQLLGAITRATSIAETPAMPTVRDPDLAHLDHHSGRNGRGAVVASSGSVLTTFRR